MTLWDAYSDRDPYYSRFSPVLRKQGFANVLLGIAGISLEPKRANLPTIKPKSSHSIKANNGAVIFDSNFESANLLHVFRNNDSQNVI